jgi:hypothetical protein
MSDPVLPPLGVLDLGDGVEYKLDLDHWLSREYDDIGHASSELPAVIEWVNAQLQSVAESKIVRKHEIKEAEARAYFRLRRDELPDGAKKTETSIAHAVALDEEVTEIYREFAVLSAWSQRLINLLFSLQAKLDLVRSTEATRRKGMSEDSADEHEQD